MKNNTFTGELAEYIQSITDEEWAYYDYLDEISEQLNDYIKQHNITKAEIARRLEKSPAYVTKLMRGDINMSFKTFVALLSVIGAKAITTVIAADSDEQIYTSTKKYHILKNKSEFRHINVTASEIDSTQYRPWKLTVNDSVKKAEYGAA